VDIAAFLDAHTKPSHAPLVPEISLHLAQDVLTLWRNTETLAGTQLPPPYWGFAWPGGQALARYVLNHPEAVAGKSVLDFGAGCGVIALAAALAGAAHVDAAEIDELAQAAILRNAAANNLHVAIRRENIIGAQENWQTVLVGDMCYERPLAESFMAWLHTLVARGTLVLLGDPGRDYFPKNGLERLESYDVPTLLDLENKPVRSTGIYKLLAAAKC
jgi:predicted nicotinamide N-methyase